MDELYHHGARHLMQEVIAYDTSGRRAEAAAMHGGMDGWREEDLAKTIGENGGKDILAIRSTAKMAGRAIIITNHTR